MNRYIRLDASGTVIAIREGSTIVDGEIESAVGELGQIRQPDGTFITPEHPTEPMQPTLDEQIAEIKEQNLILMDAIASIYEAILTGGTL